MGDVSSDVWIKMRVWLAEDPRVILMARGLAASPHFAWLRESGVTDSVTHNVTEGVTVGALLRTWGVTRRDGVREGDDLILAQIGLEGVDRIARMPGFGAVMASVGWAVAEENGDVRFPKLLRHITSPEERAREKGRDRARAFRDARRDKGRDASRYASRQGNAKVTPREEKRREDIREYHSEDLHAQTSESAHAAAGKNGVQEQPAPSPAVLTFPCRGVGASEWRLTADALAEYAELYPGLDVLCECRKALSWAIANPGKRKSAGGMPRFLANWLNEAIDRPGNRGARASSPALPTPSAPAARSSRAEQIAKLRTPDDEGGLF